MVVVVVRGCAGRGEPIYFVSLFTFMQEELEASFLKAGSFTYRFGGASYRKIRSASCLGGAFGSCHFEKYEG
jgi:hypothetical protein